MGGRPDGNRQDNRQRGNAAQLLEKYKNMARDSQLSGDRVQTEYYLQFADHYFRVLGESRSRFEDQRRQRGDDMDDDDDGDEMEADSDNGSDEDSGDDAPRADRGGQRDRQRPRRYARDERGDDDRSADNRNDEDRPARASEQRNGEDRPVRTSQRNGEDRPARANSRRGNGQLRLNDDSDDAGIALDVLPPAIGATDDSASEEAQPRRRVRRPRPPAGDEDIAPAA